MIAAIPAVAGLLGLFAPNIAKALGTSEAANAIEKVGEVLGMPGAPIDDINKALGHATTEQLKGISELDLEMAKLVADDRKDQRANNTKPENKINFTIANLYAAIAGTAFILVGSMVKLPNPESSGILMGLGSSIVGTYIVYWLGSSIGSALKNNWVKKGDMP